MVPMLAWLIGSAVLGEMKNQEQQRSYKEQQKMEAGRERWAPFTGQRGKSLARPSSIDPIMQSMLAGAMMGQQSQGGGEAAAAGGQAAGGSAGVVYNGGGGAPMANASPYSGAGPSAAAAGQPGTGQFGQFMDNNYFAPYRGG